MPSATQSQVDAINQKLKNDPQYHQLLQAHRDAAAKFNAGDVGGLNEYLLSGNALDQYLKSNNLDAHDWELDPTGDTGFNKKDGFFERNPWAVALLAGGAAVGAPAAVGLLGGASVATPVANGVLPTTAIPGAGAGAATTGLSTVTAPTVGSSMAAGDAAGMFTPSVAGTSMSAGGAGGMMSKLMTSQKLGDISSMMGNFGEAETKNRYKKADATQGYDKLMLQAQTDRNLNESDAMKKMAQTSYLMSGGRPYTPSPGLTDFGFGPQAASDAQKQGASTLQQQLLARLAPGGSYTPTKPDYLNAGTAENIGKWGGVISGGLGLLKDIF